MSMESGNNENYSCAVFVNYVTIPLEKTERMNSIENFKLHKNAILCVRFKVSRFSKRLYK